MAESNVAAAPKETQQSAKPTRKGSLLSRVAYSFGNVGQSAFYNALSTYFIVYVTSSLFSGVDKALATKLIGVITGLVVVIRIAEIFIDPLLGNIIDNTKTKWGRFKPWQLIGGTVSAVLLVLVYTGLFGLVNVNTTLFIVLFVITFIVLDVFYSLRDISYWGMIPALSSDSHERSTYTALGSFGGSIGYNGLTIVVIPIVTYFSYIFTGKHQESQSGWTCFASSWLFSASSPCAPSRSAPRKAPAPCAPRPRTTAARSPRSRLSHRTTSCCGWPCPTCCTPSPTWPPPACSCTCSSSS